MATATAERPRLTRKAKRRREFEIITATRAGLDLDKMPDPRSLERDEEYGPFDGPRLTYTWLIGESPTWSGPDSLVLYFLEGQALCRCCHHLRRMPSHAYCLGCDRAGREHLIPPPPLRRRIKRQRDEALKGGVG